MFEVSIGVIHMPLQIFINLKQVFTQNKYRLVNVFRITDTERSEVLWKVNNLLNLLQWLHWCNRKACHNSHTNIFPLYQTLFLKFFQSNLIFLSLK